MLLNAAEILLLLMVFALGAVTAWLFRRLRYLEEKLSQLISINEDSGDADGDGEDEEK